MKKILVTGRTVEEAIRAGLSQLNVVRDQVEVNVIEQPAKGLFGLIGSKEAKVELELKPDAASQAIHFLNDVFSAMHIDVMIERVNSDEHILLNLSGDELGMLIGRRGQTLDSLQYLVNIVANRHSNAHVRIVLDAENFRERRKITLEELADRLANRVVRSKKEVILEPMSPLERKIIHSYLQNRPDVTTFSKGDEPNRRVVIGLKSVTR